MSRYSTSLLDLRFFSYIKQKKSSVIRKNFETYDSKFNKNLCNFPFKYVRLFRRGKNSCLIKFVYDGIDGPMTKVEMNAFVHDWTQFHNFQWKRL